VARADRAPQARSQHRGRPDAASRDRPWRRSVGELRRDWRTGACRAATRGRVRRLCGQSLPPPGCGQPRAADRLQQRCQLAHGSRCRPAPGDYDPGSARRGPATLDAAASHRGCRPGVLGRRVGGTDGAGGHEALRHSGSDLVSARGGNPCRQYGSRLHAVPVAADRGPVRHGPGAQGFRPRSGWVHQERSEGLGRGKASAGAQSAGWIPDRAHFRASGGRGPDVQQPGQAGSGRSGLQSRAPLAGPGRPGG